MTRSEIETTVDRILRDHLGAIGFDGADVAFGRDHEGDESILITARFKRASDPSSSLPMLDVLGSLRRTLLDEGEDRFPYVEYAFPERGAGFGNDAAG